MNRILDSLLRVDCSRSIRLVVGAAFGDADAKAETERQRELKQLVLEQMAVAAEGMNEKSALLMEILCGGQYGSDQRRFWKKGQTDRI